MKPSYRADHIGSLLRPAALREEIHKIYEPGHTALLAEERAKDLTRLRELEDEQIRAVVAKQEAIGLPVVTDGEFRRLMYFNSFYDAVDGVVPSKIKLAFKGDDGSVVEHEGPVQIAGRLTAIDSPAAREVSFVKEITDSPVKVTFPGISFVYLQAALGGAAQNGGYTDLDEAAEDLLRIQRSLVEDAIAAGATFVQFDAAGSTMVSTSPALSGYLKSLGHDPQTVHDRCLDLDRRIVDGLPDNVTTGLHICRGNYASRTLNEHDGLGDVGESMFALPYDRFMVEWDDHLDRTAADYSSLESVERGGATVVLGVVSTRHAAMETVDSIVSKVERASNHIPLDQLAISPQCGFSSALAPGDDDRPDGNLVDEDTEWRKLELLVTAAEQIWGSAGQ